MTKENESHVMSRLFLEIASSTSDISGGAARVDVCFYRGHAGGFQAGSICDCHDVAPD
jgi:hypothetical protein